MGIVGYTTTDKMEARISDAMQGNAALSAAQKTLAADCLRDAYHCILAALTRRGVSREAAEDWVEGAAFQLDIAVFLYFERATLPEQSRDVAGIDRLDRRAELASCVLLNSLYQEIPAGGTTTAAVWNMREAAS